MKTEVVEAGRIVAASEIDSRAQMAAMAIAEDYGIKTELALHRKRGTHSWVFLDGEEAPSSDDNVPTFAVKLATDSDLVSLYTDTVRRVRYANSLNAAGAQLMEYVGEPQEKDGFVVTISRYLPRKVQTAEDYRQFGIAQAALHNAGNAHPITSELEPLDPLKKTRATFNYLRELSEAGQVLRLGNAEFPSELVQVFGSHLAAAEVTLTAMEDRIKEKGTPLTVLQSDVHPANVRLEMSRKARLIDLDRLSVGPAELDHGRTLSQGVQRFGRSLGHILSQFMSYVEHADRELDITLLTQSKALTSLQFATGILGDAAEAHQQQVEVEPVHIWMVTEGTRRLANLEDPYFAWESLEAFLDRQRRML